MAVTCFARGMKPAHGRGFRRASGCFGRGLRCDAAGASPSHPPHPTSPRRAQTRAACRPQWGVGCSGIALQKQQSARTLSRTACLPPGSEDEESLVSTSVFDENINAFCSLDEDGKPLKTKKSLGEMEQEYLDALRMFYESGTPSISDEEFDILKDELTWEGSSVVMMTKEEQMFLEATKAYAFGKPIMGDEEFNKLKMKLKEQGSSIAVGGPRCSLRSRRVYSDLTVDYLRLTLLNIPAVLVSLGGLYSIDALLGFRVTKFLELPEPFGFIAVWLVVLPLLFVSTDALTKLVVKDAFILKGQCTNCGNETVLFFGNILGVGGMDKVSDVTCEVCKTKMSANCDTRELTQIT